MDASLKLEYDPFMFTTGMFSSGEAEQFCALLEDEEQRKIAEAELNYYRGNVTKAASAFGALLGSENDNIAISATLGTAISSLSGGDINIIIHLYRFAKELSDSHAEDDPLKKMCDFLLLYFNILLHNTPDIRFPAYGVQAFAVPESLKPMAFYIYAHYLISIGDIGRAIGMAEGALIFMKHPSPISEIYLSLIISVGYMLRRIWDKAEYYFRHAWSLAKPDGIVMPFAEFRGMLSGLLEKCLRYEEPSAYKQISKLSNRYHKQWVFLHNLLTGEKVSDQMTAIEFNVASLAASGLSNQEIADFLGITLNSVRAHLRNIFNKLAIGSRKELSDYVI